MAIKTSIITGPHVIVYVNGKPFAHAAAFSYEESKPQKPIYGVDTLLPLDMVPGPLSYSAQLQMYRMRKLGGIEGDGLAPSWAAATRGKYFSLMLIDRATQDVLFEGHKNVVTGQSWNVATKSIMTGSVNFTGLFYANGWESPTG